MKGGVTFDSQGNMIGRLGKINDYFFEKDPSDNTTQFQYARQKAFQNLKEKATDFYDRNFKKSEVIPKENPKENAEENTEETQLVQNQGGKNKRKTVKRKIIKQKTMKRKTDKRKTNKRK